MTQTRTPGAQTFLSAIVCDMLPSEKIMVAGAALGAVAGAVLAAVLGAWAVPFMALVAVGAIVGTVPGHVRMALKND